MALSAKHYAFAAKLGNMPPNARNQAIAQHKADPNMSGHINAILADPHAAALATGGMPGGSGGAGAEQIGATDPSGAYNPNRQSGFGASTHGVRRKQDMRHQILGFGAIALTSGGSNQKVVAKPQVSFKGLRLVVPPSIINNAPTISQILVGTTNQLAANTLMPMDVFSPTSYAGDIDLSLCGPAIDISILVNATSATTWYAGIVGLVKTRNIAPNHTKVQAMGMTPQVLAPTQSVTFSYNPQLDFVPRKISLTPGTTFADQLIVTNVQCGQQLQTASSDPYPAALHSDLFPLDLDWDLINAAVALQWSVTNISAGQVCTFQGIVHGDVSPDQLARAATSYV